MAKVKSNEEIPPKGGFFSKIWHTLSFLLLGVQWMFKELFTKHVKFDIQKTQRRPGEVAVITGGTRGIGLELLKYLLELDMNVVLGVRNTKVGVDLVTKLRDEGYTKGSAFVLQLDLTSLHSVATFANEVLQQYHAIHFLINNAGIMAVPFKKTPDGFESQLQVNYLSHFLLTQLLLPRLIQTGKVNNCSKIINVSSSAQFGGKINFDDFLYEKYYSPEFAYMNSKLMQTIFTRYLDDNLKTDGKFVKVYAVHPGVVRSDLHNTMCLFRTCGCCLGKFYKTPKQGADGIMNIATAPDTEKMPSGNFYANSKKQSLPKSAGSLQIQKKLWDTSEKLVSPWINHMGREMIIDATLEGVTIDGKKKVRRKDSTQSRTRKTSFYSVRNDSVYGSISAKSITEMDIVSTGEVYSIEGESESVVSFPSSDEGNDSGSGEIGKAVVITEFNDSTMQVSQNEKETKGYVNGTSSRSSSEDTVCAIDEMPKISVE